MVGSIAWRLLPGWSDAAGRRGLGAETTAQPTRRVLASRLLLWCLQHRVRHTIGRSLLLATPFSLHGEGTGAQRAEGKRGDDRGQSAPPRQRCDGDGRER